ncbi:DUF4269 domain-containing protein [Sphingobacterium hungaricum]|uniref:DUF4269 domain-containing protein n=1 Tax=Sphingobacterium hungaricum TaxID=2082723 RepID=A0A928UXL7_9SPHI|nr:DUF4269 domain-containing protein [Sphingobacterium hungaricum]MBE8713838.1 DUF4269 domain-containing protein [Sphingobacterium hungaricum]
MHSKFDTIDYLKTGNELQKRAYEVLTNHCTLEKLKDFNPILCGTIPIDIAIENSDLDIICSHNDKAIFRNTITTLFQNEQNFYIIEKLIRDTESIVASFLLDGFAIEIFSQPIPTKEQHAYKHMIIEHEILMSKGEEFRQQIIDLKHQGYKTEPAFAKLLNLTKDPYLDLLNYTIH